jgi:predicted O-linked N-acetylglucosamine transferase (SPINDLY family)
VPDPDALDARLAAGKAAFGAGDIARARSLFTAAIAEFPGSAEPALLLATVLRHLEQPHEARAVIVDAIRRHPGIARAHAQLGGVLIDLGDADAAEAACRRALDIDPACRPASMALGLALMARPHFDAAIEALGAALAHGPDDVGLRINLAAACEGAGRLDEALAHALAALQLDPERIEALATLAGVHVRQGDGASARAATRAAMAAASRLGPDIPASARQALSKLLFALSYADDLAPADLIVAHRAWGRVQQAHLAWRRPAGLSARRERRMRVGFVSPDLRAHPVAFFLKPLIDAFDKTAVEIAFYSDVRAPDGYTRALRARSDVWRDCAGLSDDAMARVIAEDQVDVLIDLAGHTGGNRLGVFARKPAPVQATWLGYPASTGLAAIDCRIVDAVTDPAGSDALSVEGLARLPGCFLCYEPPPSPVEPSRLPALSTGVVTFGSFNNFAKLSPATARLWAGALAAVPRSRLLLKSRDARDAGTRARLLGMFARLGIATSRIDFQDWQANLDLHLQAYERIDIALDSFPYNGTTTTCEAHWMGVPVVTLAGDRHAARVGASLSRALGLDHLVASSPEEFAAIAARLAADLPALAAFRASARARMRSAPLLDATTFARGFEALLHRIAVPPRRGNVPAVPSRGTLPPHTAILLPGPEAPLLLAPGDVDTNELAVLLAPATGEDAEHIFLSRLLRPGGTVVDLAPGLGARALLAARAVGPAGSVRFVASSDDAASLLVASAARNGCPQLRSLRDAGAHDDPPLTAAREIDLAVISGASTPTAPPLAPEGLTARVLRLLPAVALLADAQGEPARRDTWADIFSAYGLDPFLLVPGLGVLAPRIWLALDGAEDPLQEGAVFGLSRSASPVLAERGLACPALAPDPPATGAVDRSILLARLPFAMRLARSWPKVDIPPVLEAALADWLDAHAPSVPAELRVARLLRASRCLALAARAPDHAPNFAIAMSRVRIELELGRRGAALGVLRHLLDNRIPVSVDLPFLPPLPRFDSLPIGRAFSPWYRAAVYEATTSCMIGRGVDAARVAVTLCEQAVATGLHAPETALRLRILRHRLRRDDPSPERRS